MIFTWILVTAAWSSLIATSDLGGFVLPDIAIAISIWGGLRAWRRNEDFILALIVGLVAGLFSVDPWFMSPLCCLLAVVLAAGLRTRVAPQSLLGRSLVICVVYLSLYGIECLLRMSVPSLILGGTAVLNIGYRTLGGIPLTILLDKVTPQRT
ncbi:MAG: hypothetical protein ACI97A_000601 [Planctomycetota bacterium]|jgi:hypothetical protein